MVSWHSLIVQMRSAISGLLSDSTNPTRERGGWDGWVSSLTSRVGVGTRTRGARLERLDDRLCMASDWTNPIIPLDVDESGLATPNDALVVINYLNREQPSRLAGPRPSGSPFIDSNGDGFATALDALVVINALNRYPNDPPLVVGIDPASDPDGNGVLLGSSVTFRGQSTQGTRIVVESTAGETLSSDLVENANGQFEIDVALTRGIHDFDFIAIDPRGQTTSTTRRVRGGDLATNWNATVLNVVREWTTVSDDPYEGRIVPSEPPRVARNLAMIHTAFFDAINAAEETYESYLTISNRPDAFSASAAASAAAFKVAIELYPDADSMAYWNTTLEESLRSIVDGPEKEAGLAFGRAIGRQMLDARANDGSEDLTAYSHGDQPGDWQRTFPGYLPPLLPHWMNIEPFVVEDVTQYRPEAPPPLTSQAYAASVDEVMQLGGLNSEVRTDDQSEIAVFWADGGGTFTPPGHWNQIAADVMIERDQSLVENARTFALLNLALADAGIASWDAKYHYDLWRPIDAIQHADTDGNPDTVQDETWRPLLINPPFPTYTSGHSTFSGAADGLLTAVLGDNVSFISQTDAHSAVGQKPLDPSLIVTRSFTSFTHAAEEAGLSRIYGGIHFDFDNTEGLAAGRAIGAFVAESQLQPVR